ncbi:hypothetical protein G5V59_06870 [Nocardioides sp. W3-2-3]|uniref:hypothetical protein n=1 Tax=Nocardioides convexus TaxID=2712224 RepID=UPI00241823AD|nr:hypothetical protein [Nocardioides convexus]NHA00028.1 hypothetical protein [Nocardioides convexus]
MPFSAWVLTMGLACVLLALGVLVPLSCLTIAAGNALLMAADQQALQQPPLPPGGAVRAVRHSLLGPRVGAGRREPACGRGRHGPPGGRRLLVVAAVSACYLFAGLSKANPEFLSGHLIGSLSPDWVPARLAAWATVPAEIGIGLGLWWRRVRRLAPALGVLLHLSIVVLLSAPVVFTAFALLCLTGYPLVWTWPALDQAEAASTQRSSVP